MRQEVDSRDEVMHSEMSEHLLPTFIIHADDVVRRRGFASPQTALSFYFSLHQLRNLNLQQQVFVILLSQFRSWN